jgi:restriction endonuclease S subunit
MNAGDIVLALDRPLISTGLKVARIEAEDTPSLLLQRVARITCSADELDPDYLWYWLHSPFFVEALNPGRSNGVPHISTGELSRVKLLLPPIGVQVDVVRLLETAWKAVAAFEQEQARAANLRRKLTKTAMRELAAKGDSFALEHLSEIVQSVRDVGELDDAILALAATGRLGLPGIEVADTGWSVKPLSQIVRLTNGRAFKAADWRSRGLPIIRIQNLNDVHAPYNYADPAAVDNRHKVYDGDVLLSWSGTPGTSFGVFLWTRGPAVLNQHIFRCEIRKEVSKRWFQIAVNYGISQMLDLAHGGVGLKHLTKKQLDSMCILVPPLSEQGRIVSLVDQLGGLSDRLRATMPK